MFKTILTTILIVLAAVEINAAKLDVTITNINNDIGMIRFTLFNRSNYFPNDDAGIQTTRMAIPAKKNKVSFTVLVPAGTYAAAAYHDTNNNEKLDKSFFFNMPTEPYGFSNNARGAFGPPDFTQAAFSIPNNRTSLIFDVQ